MPHKVFSNRARPLTLAGHLGKVRPPEATVITIFVGPVHKSDIINVLICNHCPYARG